MKLSGGVRHRVSCATGAFLLLFVAACEFGPGEDTELTMERVGTSDTISIFATVRFAFSEPVGGPVMLSMEPDPGTVYHTQLNRGRDTLDLVVTGLLAGTTRYVIRPKGTVVSDDGSVLSNTVSFTVLTRAAEQEPNDKADSSIADRFVNPIQGFVSSALDTDVYYVPDSTCHGLYLYSPDASRCNFAVVGAGGRRVVARTATSVGEGRIDTLMIPDSLGFPLFAQVFSLSGIAGLRYELGAASR